MSQSREMLVLAVMLLACAAKADEGSLPAIKGFDPARNSRLATLLDAEVRGALEITAEQQQSLEALQARWAEEFGAWQRLPDAERTSVGLARVEAKAPEFEQQALAILSAAQRGKLEILHQRRSWRAISPLRFTLDSPRLQEELQLSDEQRATVRRFDDEWVEQCERLHEQQAAKGKPLTSFGAIETLYPKYEPRGEQLTRDTLNAEQQRRMAELKLQKSLATNAAKELSKPEVADKLKLTPDQRRRIAVTLEQSEEQMRGEGRPRKWASTEGLEVLTPEQKDEVRKMLGKPFYLTRILSDALADPANPKSNE